MQLKCFLALIFLSNLFTDQNRVQCKKYDLDFESMKLYGEDLATVVKKFRRSAEYVAILEDKLSEFDNNLIDMLAQVQEAYMKKMETQITQDFPDEYVLMNKSRSSPALRQSDRNTTESSILLIKTLSPIEKLDVAIPGLHELTYAEMKLYKDLGYEYAGKAVHAMIKYASVSSDSENADRRTTLLEKPKSDYRTTHEKGHKVPAKSTTVKFRHGGEKHKNNKTARHGDVMKSIKRKL